jgi:hypothetical protein
MKEPKFKIGDRVKPNAAAIAERPILEKIGHLTINEVDATTKNRLRASMVSNGVRFYFFTNNKIKGLDKKFEIAEAGLMLYKERAATKVVTTKPKRVAKVIRIGQTLHDAAGYKGKPVTEIDSNGKKSVFIRFNSADDILAHQRANHAAKVYKITKKEALDEELRIAYGKKGNQLVTETTGHYLQVAGLPKRKRK